MSDRLKLTGSILSYTHGDVQQTLDLDTILGVHDGRWILRENGRYSSAALCPSLDHDRLVAWLPRKKGKAVPAALNVRAHFIDHDIGLTIPLDFKDAACQTTLPLDRRSLRKARILPELVLEMERIELNHEPLWTHANVSEQLALRFFGLAERELLRERPHRTAHILPGWLEGDARKAYTKPLVEARSRFLRDFATLVDSPPDARPGLLPTYLSTIESAWAIVCELASDSATMKNGFVCVHLRDAREHLRRAVRFRSRQRERDAARGNDSERVRKRRLKMENRLSDLAMEIGAMIDKAEPLSPTLNLTVRCK